MILVNTRSVIFINKPKFSNKLVYIRMELDLHSDSIVAGANCCIMQYANRQFDFSSYCENGNLGRNASIAQATTTCKPAHVEEIVVLVLSC